ncbi:hypothetical protein ILP92_03665 [Maribius pontilimi]|uniref:Uncharacterized protein n=1 Tax=Palleronia pontilimi TaxID=1964209 RepID=A0A934IE82_9RHOB|nr:hypothetical protein [Palleronia pontilimi]MBJ3761845.1 hypothetical protein [Palleronia pontilimi]
MSHATGLKFTPFLLLAALAPAQASQPIHESLVERGVLVDAMIGQQTPIVGSSDFLDMYVHAAEQFRLEATRRSDAAYVGEMSRRKLHVWEDRWDAGDWDDPANRGELVDWWTYCFKLYDHVGLTGPR